MLVKRPEGDFEGGKWCLVGGKPEPNENLVKALFREIFEELGAPISLISHFAEIENPDRSKGRWSTHYFLGTIDGVPKINLQEISGFGFFSIEEILNMGIAFDHKEILKALLRENTNSVSSFFMQEF